MSLHGSVVKPLIGSRMKPQLYTNDFDTFQSTNAYLGVEESLLYKNMYVMVQINPHSEPLPRFREGFQLCGIHQIYTTLLDRPFSIQDWNSW